MMYHNITLYCMDMHNYNFTTKILNATFFYIEHVKATSLSHRFKAF